MVRVGSQGPEDATDPPEPDAAHDVLEEIRRIAAVESAGLVRL